ncbi:hypothetical protein PEBR_13572 [Penicillium brasilianum]|uniref:Uncharacterized protein n=1 Tax=Penicillium brasilianum TaxID=104259 RepID=A0A1S9RSQ4_PENBI|nr:hypothetical protein PEBR_13572 [Penicillium brasilianum]
MTSSIVQMTHAIHGAASGMEFSAVHTLLARGVQITVCDLSEWNFEALPVSPRTIHPVLHKDLDVTDHSAIDWFFHETLERLGSLKTSQILWVMAVMA